MAQGHGGRRRSLPPVALGAARGAAISKDVPALEAAGVVVRMPANWRMNRPARAQVKATVGANAPAQLGLDALLDFCMEVTLDGEALTTAEIKRLLAQGDGLAFIRGQWVEIDHDRLSRTLKRFEAIERRAAAEGLSFAEAMRLLAGANLSGDDAASQTDRDWCAAVAGPWLAETLAALRRPDGRIGVDPERLLKGTLRPYQIGDTPKIRFLSPYQRVTLCPRQNCRTAVT